MAERLQPTTNYAMVNGLRLRYLEWGRPGALPVVCVHGYTSSTEAFNALARRIQDRAHIIAMDVRGHGESGWPAAATLAPRSDRGGTCASGTRRSIATSLGADPSRQKRARAIPTPC